MVKTESIFDGIDSEWLNLIREAKELGLSKELILDFLHQNEIGDNLAKVL